MAYKVQRGSERMLRQKGVITVYLAMIFLVVLSLILTVAESARMQGVRMLLETALDGGLESFAAGYQRELFEQYDIFFFDGSYNQQFSEESLAGKLRENMNYTFQPNVNTLLVNTDFYQVDIDNINIDKIALATDDNGKVFRNQVVDFVKASMGIQEIERLTEKYNWTVNNVQESNSYSEKEKETDQTLLALETEKAAVDSEKTDEANTAKNQKNPTEEINSVRSAGILNLVYSDTSQLSQKSLNVDSLPSNRTLNKGTGLEAYDEDVVSKILFQSYLMHKFTNAADIESVSEHGKGTAEQTISEDNLQYQLEYLLIGQASDIDNLKGVVNRILFMREGANFTYLLTDAAKVAEAYSAATLLVGYTGLVPLIEATKYAILLAWAYAESVLDVKVLLAGEKAALIKTAENWKTSLANIGQVATMNPTQMADSTGITYEEYLQMLLLTANQEELSMRALDLIELQIRTLTGNHTFQIDHCISMLEATVTIKSESVFLTLPFMNSFNNYNSKRLYATRRIAYGEMR